ncbi:MAG: hypothetical protein VB118_11545 [Oscillospiraceae bacterium]|nr:hypothetical protein [Oscillospiraceae bacterium]
MRHTSQAKHRRNKHESTEPQEAVIKGLEPYKSEVRKSGTGGIYEINNHLYEGRYTPTNAHGERVKTSTQNAREMR